MIPIDDIKYERIIQQKAWAFPRKNKYMDRSQKAVEMKGEETDSQTLPQDKPKIEEVMNPQILPQEKDERPEGEGIVRPHIPQVKDEKPESEGEMTPQTSPQERDEGTDVEGETTPQILEGDDAIITKVITNKETPHPWPHCA